MITIDQLQHAINQRINALIVKRDTAVQTQALMDARQHVLAVPITAPFAVPRQDVSAMDGYAISEGSNLNIDACFTVIGESKAGVPFTDNIKPNQAVRIFTGAVVPTGCDTVVMQEHTKTKADGGTNQVCLTQSATAGSNIRKQGEEIEQNEVVLPAGKRLTPADISLLANLGVDAVCVYSPLTVGLLATGDELVELGQPLVSLAHIYNSNTPTLKSLLADLPVTIKDYGIIVDDLNATMHAVTHAVQECDVLISTAGVSVGDYDFLTTVIEQLGQINHYKVAMKPGKPFVFGELVRQYNTQALNTTNRNSQIKADAKTNIETNTAANTETDIETKVATDQTVLYFGLPGNPLSAVIGTLIFIMPALWQLSGAAQDQIPMTPTITATLANDIKKRPGRADYQRGILKRLDDGRYRVTAFTTQQSHRVKQLSQANCLIVLAKDAESMASGEQVTVMPLPWA